MSLIEIAPPARKPKLAEMVVEALRKRIAAGEFGPGEKLPTESQMTTHFGVSRTVVREAIANLKASGSVSTVQGLGAFVVHTEKQNAFQIEEATNLSVAQEMIKVLELRFALEAESVALAAQRRQDAHLDNMRASLDTLRAAMASGEFSTEVGERAAEADIAFHRAIAEATGNMHFLRLFNYLGEYMVSRSRLQTFKFGGGPVREYLERTIMEHERIYLAIEAQDAETARAAMRLHLAGSRDRLKKRIANYTSQ